MVAMVNSVVTVGPSLEKKSAVGQAPNAAADYATGQEGPPAQKQKMLKMNERTHYVL